MLLRLTNSSLVIQRAINLVIKVKMKWNYHRRSKLNQIKEEKWSRMIVIQMRI